MVIVFDERSPEVKYTSTLTLPRRCQVNLPSEFTMRVEPAVATSCPLVATIAWTVAPMRPVVCP